jgi:UDPglucose 6-dehydrogenase
MNRPDVSVVSNPEFLREGSAVHDFLHPDRIVIGSEDQGAAIRVAALYLGVPAPVVVTDPASAETIKYAANAFLAGKVSFINEIARICELVGADVTAVAHGIGLDKRINSKFLQAGIGWGGSCFGKDLSSLIATAADGGYDAPLLRAIVDVNTRQRELVVTKLQHHLRPLRGSRVTVLGLAFKPGTDDLRDAPALEIGDRLRKLGATVVVYDPVIESVTSAPWMRVMRDAYAAAAGTDAVVVATDWPEFVDIDIHQLASVMRGSLLLDARNCLDAASVAAAGLVYEGIGRPAVAPGTGGYAFALPAQPRVIDLDDSYDAAAG